MPLFNKRKSKKEAEEAKKKAEAEAAKARIAGYEKEAAESKAKQAAARSEKAEKELKEMKAAKARRDAIDRRKAAASRSTIKAAPGSSPGSTVIPGVGRVPLGAKIIAEYTVKKGDTLSQIAKNYYGSGSQKYWKLIQDANKDTIKDPNLIHPGQVFKIPVLPDELKKK